MSIKNFFDVRELFNPTIFYPDTFELSDGLNLNKDPLIINSKIEHGQNQYGEYLLKYYYGPLAKMFDSVSLASTVPPVVVTTVVDGKRCTRISFAGYVCRRLVGGLTPEENLNKYESLPDDISQEELNQFIRAIIREDKRMAVDVKRKGEASEYYENIMAIYNSYTKFSEYNAPFSTFLEDFINGQIKLLTASRTWLSFFDQDLNIEEMISCFDYDKLCLLLAKRVLINAKMAEKEYNSISNLILFVTQYLEAIAKMRERNPEYNCEVSYYDGDKSMSCDVDSVIAEYEELMVRHPEYIEMRLPKKEIEELLRTYGYDEKFIAKFDLASPDAMLLKQLLEHREEQRALLASWRIIPQIRTGSIGTVPHGGNVIYPVPEGEASIDYDENIEEEPQSIQDPKQQSNEKVRIMLISRRFLESSNYQFRLEGINEFEGYQGYLYPNGIVIFEKYYENVKTKRVAKESATYVMNLSNFAQISRLAKSDIISKINSGAIKGVSRIFHRKDMKRWEAEVKQAISGSDYSAQVEAYIDSLTANKVVSRKGGKR